LASGGSGVRFFSDQFDHARVRLGVFVDVPLGGAEVAVSGKGLNVAQ
jgi:hypothetical protein